MLYVLLFCGINLLTGCMSAPKYSPQLLSDIYHDLTTCDTNPHARNCYQAIHDLLLYNAQSQYHQVKSAVSAKKVLDVMYNGKQAQQLFLTRIPDINSRANFFATNDRHFHNTAIPVRWFGASEHISRRCVFGLGAKGCGSKLTFSMAKNISNPRLYQWRHAVGNEILLQGFSDFKALFNKANTPHKISNRYNKNAILNAKQWDIEQLQKEQALTQPLHKKYLADHPAFLILSKRLTGVDLLDEPSRLKYGYTLLGY